MAGVDTAETLLDNIDSTQGRPVKRQKITKVTRACDRCKQRKRRCTGEQPCSICVSTASQCHYNATYTRGKLVEPRASQGIEDQTKDFDLNTLPASRKTIVESAPAKDVEVAVHTGNNAGAGSAHAFLKRAWERFGRKSADGESLPGIGQDGNDQNASIFSYGDRRPSPLESRALRSIQFDFPAPTVAKRLVTTYFELAMPTYKFLHRPTVERWLAEHYGSVVQLRQARRAIVLMVLATGMLFEANNPDDEMYKDAQVLQRSEQYFQEARSILAVEQGRPKLESVQARLAVCLYSLHTGRPNEAWYGFGTLVQIIFILGVHQSRDKDLTSGDMVLRECRKRTFWAAATLDIYLSVMLGRPPLLHDEDISQQYPRELDDDELGPENDSDPESKDRLISASICHARIAMIVRQAVKAQNAGHSKTASTLVRELNSWKASLPMVLRGLVNPSSLVAGFRRQHTVLELAHSHAAILINRPLLLADNLNSLDRSDILSCLHAANIVLDMLTSSKSDRAPLEAFWFTQYVAFNAVSVVYVWVIQRKCGRLTAVTTHFTDQDLMRKADAVQAQFAAAGLHYNIVLEELQQEIRALEGASLAQHPVATLSRTQLPNAARQGPAATEQDLLFEPTPLDLELVALDPDLWLQLDSFPFSNIGLEQWVSPPEI